MRSLSQKIFKAWKAFGHMLGLVMSKVIFTVLYIVGVGVYAIIAFIIRFFSSSHSSKSTWRSKEDPPTWESMSHPF